MIKKGIKNLFAEEPAEIKVGDTVAVNHIVYEVLEIDKTRMPYTHLCGDKDGTHATWYSSTALLKVDGLVAFAPEKNANLEVFWLCTDSKDSIFHKNRVYVTDGNGMYIHEDEGSGEVLLDATPIYKIVTAKFKAMTKPLNTNPDYILPSTQPEPLNAVVSLNIGDLFRINRSIQVNEVVDIGSNGDVKFKALDSTAKNLVRVLQESVTVHKLQGKPKFLPGDLVGRTRIAYVVWDNDNDCYAYQSISLRQIPVEEVKAKEYLCTKNTRNPGENRYWLVRSSNTEKFWKKGKVYETDCNGCNAVAENGQVLKTPLQNNSELVVTETFPELFPSKQPEPLYAVGSFAVNLSMSDVPMEITDCYVKEGYMAYELTPEGKAPYVRSEASLSEDGVVFKTFRKADEYIAAMVESANIVPSNPEPGNLCINGKEPLYCKDAILAVQHGGAYMYITIYDINISDDGSDFVYTYYNDGLPRKVMESHLKRMVTTDTAKFRMAYTVKEHDAIFREEPNFVRYRYAKLFEGNQVVYLKTCSEDETTYGYETCWEDSVQTICSANKLALLPRQPYFNLGDTIHSTKGHRFVQSITYDTSADTFVYATKIYHEQSVIMLDERTARDIDTEYNSTIDKQPILVVVVNFNSFGLEANGEHIFDLVSQGLECTSRHLTIVVSDKFSNLKELSDKEMKFIIVVPETNDFTLNQYDGVPVIKAAPNYDSFMNALYILSSVDDTNYAKLYWNYL